MDHPYKQLEGTPIWKGVEDAIAVLVKNGDLVEQTSRDYIVGYISTQVEQLTWTKSDEE